MNMHRELLQFNSQYTTPVSSDELEESLLRSSSSTSMALLPPAPPPPPASATGGATVVSSTPLPQPPVHEVQQPYQQQQLPDLSEGGGEECQRDSPSDVWQSYTDPFRDPPVGGTDPSDDMPLLYGDDLDSSLFDFLF
jgi:hypothetical protein